MINDLVRVKIPVDRRKIDLQCFRLQFSRIVLTKKIISVLNDIIQDEETIHFPEESYLISDERIDLVILTQEDQEPVFHHRVDKITEYRFVTGIAYHAAEKIKIEHTAAHPEPIIIPATEQFKIINHRKVTDVPVDKNRNDLKRTGVAFCPVS